MSNMGNVPEQANKWTKGKMTIVTLRKQTGFNQDSKFRCLGGKYQDLFFQSGFHDTADLEDILHSLWYILCVVINFKCKSCACVKIVVKKVE